MKSSAVIQRLMSAQGEKVPKLHPVSEEKQIPAERQTYFRCPDAASEDHISYHQLWIKLKNATFPERQ